MKPRIQRLFVLRAQSGDIEALDKLFQSVQSRLYAYLRGLVGDPHLAEDVLQDVFVLVHRKLLWLREPELFRPWVHRIATREAFRALKKLRRHPEEEFDEALDAPEGEEPAPQGPDDELIERLPQLVQRLTPKSRPVLLLHYWEGLTLEAVAAVLEISVGTVKSRLAYGLGQLREAVAAEEVAVAPPTHPTP